MHLACNPIAGESPLNGTGNYRKDLLIHDLGQFRFFLRWVPAIEPAGGCGRLGNRTLHERKRRGGRGLPAAGGGTGRRTRLNRGGVLACQTENTPPVRMTSRPGSPCCVYTSRKRHSTNSVRRSNWVTTGSAAGDAAAKRYEGHRRARGRQVGPERRIDPARLPAATAT